MDRDAQGRTRLADKPLTLVPYYAWANRKIGEMAVWFPRDPGDVKEAPPETERRRRWGRTAAVSFGRERHR